MSTPNTTGTPVSSATRARPAAHSPGDVLEVRGVAPDDRTDAHDRVPLPRFCEALRDDGKLERTGHPEHRRVVALDAVGRELGDGPGFEQ